jgi:hypothetical protein
LINPEHVECSGALGLAAARVNVGEQESRAFDRLIEGFHQQTFFT